MTLAPLTVERVIAWDPAALGTAASGLDDVAGDVDTARRRLETAGGAQAPADVLHPVAGPVGGATGERGDAVPGSGTPVVIRPAAPNDVRDLFAELGGSRS